MPDRLLGVRDALFNITQQVRLLGTEANQDDLAAVMDQAQEPLASLAQARSNLTASKWTPNRERITVLAQAALILHRQQTGLLPRAIPGRQGKKPQTFTIEGVTGLCENVLADFNDWLMESTAVVGRINGAKAQVSALRQALAYLRRRNDDYAVLYYVKEHMDNLRNEEDRCDKTMLAVRALVTTERETTLPLIEALREALVEIEKMPKDRGARADLQQAAEDLLEHMRSDDE